MESLPRFWKGFYPVKYAEEAEKTLLERKKIWSFLSKISRTWSFFRKVFCMSLDMLKTMRIFLKKTSL